MIPYGWRNPFLRSLLAAPRPAPGLPSGEPEGRADGEGGGESTRVTTACAPVRA